MPIHAESVHISWAAVEKGFVAYVSVVESLLEVGQAVVLLNDEYHRDERA